MTADSNFSDGNRCENESLSFEFRLDAPPEKVWRALTIPAFRDRWLPAAANGDNRLAGPSGPVEAELVHADPPKCLSWRWRGAGDPPGLVTVVLTAAEDGCTLLHLVHHRRLPAAAPVPANANVMMARAA